MVKISDLHDAIGDTSPFDRVIQAGAVSIKDDGAVVLHLYQPYPTSTEENTGSGLTQVNFNLHTGDAAVLHRGIDWTRYRVNKRSPRHRQADRETLRRPIVQCRPVWAERTVRPSRRSVTNSAGFDRAGDLAPQADP